MTDLNMGTTNYLKKKKKQIRKREKKRREEFPGGPGVRNQHFYYQGHRFDPWSGNQDITCCVTWLKIFF